MTDRRRYRTRPVAMRAYEEDVWMSHGHPEPMIEPSEPGWVETGLLGPDGQPIMRFEGPDPIGFLWHDENGSLKPRHEFEQEDEQGEDEEEQALLAFELR